MLKWRNVEIYRFLFISELILSKNVEKRAEWIPYTFSPAKTETEAKTVRFQ